MLRSLVAAFSVFFLHQAQSNPGDIKLPNNGITGYVLGSVYHTQCRILAYILSPKSVCLDRALEEIYDGKAMSSMSTSKCKFECAKSPSMSLKTKSPDSERLMLVQSERK